MEVYCSKEFREEYEKICKYHKKYPDFVDELADYFLNKSFDEVRSGDMLYGPPDSALWKKRLPDGGGYRFYFFAFTNSKTIYLAFVHPKRGPLGAPNIRSDYKKYLHKSVLEQVKSGECLKVSLCKKTNNIVFQ